MLLLLGVLCSFTLATSGMALSPLGLVCSGGLSSSSSDVLVESMLSATEDLRRTPRAGREDEDEESEAATAYIGVPDRGSGTIRGSTRGTGSAAKGELGLPESGEGELGPGVRRWSSCGGGRRMIREASACGIQPS